jgi:hypothetical protein
MVTKKQDDATEAEQPEAPVEVERSPAPNNTARPADKPTANSTFAERAKAQGGNKRVATAGKK